MLMEGGGSALPPGVLALIFEQLEPISERLRARAVCRLWRGSAALGCAHLQVVVPRPNKGRNQIGRLRLRGRRLKLGLEDDAAAEEETAFDRDRWMKRTRGHLPQPVVLGAEEELVDTVPQALQQTPGSGAALLIDRSVLSLRSQLEVQGTAGEEAGSAIAESDDNNEDEEENTNTQYEKEQAAESCKANVLHSLDLTTSAFHPCERMSNGVDSYRDSKPRTLQRVLTGTDMGGLCWLQSLSVRGCGNLQVLLVPPCLTALDASNASRLRTLNYGHNDSVQVAGCQVLNLSGCRELQLAGLLSDPQSLSRCRELDLSYCQRLPLATVSTALASAGLLASLSLRNVANDLMLQRLAKSPAAVRTLRLTDCAFSGELTDAGVQALVQAAPRLQRVNLRGCTSVSTSCYNQTPITLATRSEDAAASANADTLAAAPREASSKMRKGDNVFFFTSR
jgi:hypothetical protein